MIILSQTYEIVSQESAEQGEAAERGFDWQDVPYTFKECVDLIKSSGFAHGSSSWLSTEPEQDYSTGDYETKSLHPGRDKQSQRYWAKACKAAGIC